MKHLQLFDSFSNDISEAYDDVNMDIIKNKKKLGEYTKYNDKIVVDNNTYLNIIDVEFNRIIGNWFTWAQIIVFDNTDGTEIANASYGKHTEDTPMKSTIDVRSDKRRIGVASNIYTWIEQLTGSTLYPDVPHSKSAQAFGRTQREILGIYNNILIYN